MNDKTSDKTSDALLNCPFCGGEAKVDIQHVRKEDVAMIQYKIKCTRCPTDFGRQWFNEYNEAVAAWNTRKPIERIVERLEEELIFADSEKKRCARENPLQFDSAKGYAQGLYNAIKIVKEEGELND